MRSFSILAVSATLAINVFAAPQVSRPAYDPSQRSSETMSQPIASSPTDLFADFPSLSGLKNDIGIFYVDPDGVYRAYLVNGTVVDAKRLTRDQIDIWLNARASQLPTAQAEEEHALY